jgi:acyl-CoA thioesterase-2
MDSFIELQRAEEFVYSLDIEAAHCVGPKGFSFLFGGAGMAAAVTAMEQSLDSDLVLANAQFQSFANFGNKLDIVVTPTEGGRKLRRAKAVGKVSGKTVFTVDAVLSEMAGQEARQWTAMPANLAAPENCSAWPIVPEQDSNARLLDRLDVRLSVPEGVPTDEENGGNLKLWIQPKEAVAMDATLISICADFLPAAVGAATQRPGGGNSLDNHVRIAQLVPTKWILCDISVHHASNGLAQGDMKLFAQDGRLLATASQTLKLR